MAQLIDLKGQRFNYLTVLEYDLEETKKHSNGAYWKCKCDCGNIKTILGKNLKSQRTKSCGCKRNQLIHNALLKDLSGQKFGRWTVLSYDEGLSKSKKSSYWICQCECGNIKSVNYSNLVDKKSLSCGCYNNEETSKRFFKDLTGQKFGKLTVLELDKQLTSQLSSTYWICLCECGNIKSILSHSLLKGNTHSCGCLKTSLGEYNIEQILKQNNISYIREYKFQDLGLLRYDFYLPDFNRLVEFDGEQHFQKKEKHSWDINGKYEQRIFNDEKKNNYALTHNINLIRIPYWERDNITLEMILGNKYLIIKGEC